MISRRTIYWIYDNVHAALWALLCTALLFLIVIIFPRLPKIHDKADRMLAQEIAAESKFYCERWGMRAGTHQHTLCVLDLATIRENVTRRLTPPLP